MQSYKHIARGCFAVACLLAAITFSQVQSAQAQPRQVQTWTGFYIGANAGYAWGNSDLSTDVRSRGNYFTGNDPDLIAGEGHGSGTSSNGIGGVQAGFNWRYGDVLFGAEADINSFSMHTSRTASRFYQTAPGTFFTINQDLSTDWLFTARTRFGMVMNDTWLLYVTGGMAATKLNYTNTFTDTSFAARENGSVDAYKIGYAAGFGVEYAYTSNWSIKAEYLYVNFGDVTSAGSVATTGGFTAVLNHGADLNTQIVRVGINYRFPGLGF